MYKTYFKTTLRNLWRNKTYSFLNIFGLAIGITCAGLILLWVEDEVDFDKVNAKKERLYSVQVNLNTSETVYTIGSTPRPMAAALKQEIPGIINTVRVSDENLQSLFGLGDHSLYASGLYADPSLFTMFTLPFIQGNAKTVFANLYSLVVTEKTAIKFFGSAKDVVGKTVRVDNNQDFVITGVLKDLPANATLQFEWLAPYQVSMLQWRHRLPGQLADEVNWGALGPLTYVELAPNANPAMVNSQMKHMIRNKLAGSKNTCFLFPMKDWRLYGEFENGVPTGSGRIKQVKMLSMIAWIILLIACINFMNLATAGSQQRAREVGVRKVLGAGRQRLILQFMGEAFLLSLLACLLAICMMSLSLQAFNGLMQKQLSLNLSDPVHLFSLLAIAALCGLIAGSYPSLYLSSFKPVLILKGLKLKSGSAAYIRKGLVVLQFGVSIIFIICTIIVYQQVQHVKNRDLGFKKDNLVEINMQHEVAKIFPLLKQDLLQTGFVEMAAVSDHTTIYGGDTDDKFTWQGKSPDNHVSFAFRSVSPEFMATAGMKIVEGRDFAQNDYAEGSTILITQSMEKMMGSGSAIGKVIQSPRE